MWLQAELRHAFSHGLFQIEVPSGFVLAAAAAMYFNKLTSLGNISRNVYNYKISQ